MQEVEEGDIFEPETEVSSTLALASGQGSCPYTADIVGVVACSKSAAKAMQAA